ncbi:lipid A deacylase LpxR family protein [soil metagenome]
MHCISFDQHSHHNSPGYGTSCYRHPTLKKSNCRLIVVILFCNLFAFSAHSADEAKPKPAVEAAKSDAEQKMIDNPKSTAKRVSEGQAFSVDVENDSKNIGGPGSDQAYSNGIKFSYVYAKDHVPFWAPRWFTDMNYMHDQISKAKANFGVALNHQIFTPNNTQIRTYIPNDRPYAAWLNLALSMQLKTPQRSQALELSLGVVGPWAQGEGVQNTFHKMIGAQEALGWENQIKNELAVQLSYQQRLRFVELRNKFGSYFDLIPFFGGGLGNVYVGAHTGLMARVGLNLPDDFGPARPSGGESDSFVSPNPAPDDLKSSYFLFAGLRGNAVARNIFLDGNTFEPSHSSTKYPVNFETEVGVGIQFMPVSIIWRYVVRSPDFEENSGFNSFASLGLSYYTH